MSVLPRLTYIVLLGGNLWLPLGQAHDGTVSITGTITDNTCTVSADSRDMTVRMGDVSKKQFSHPGDGTRYEPFSINLEKCGGATSSVSVTFIGNTDPQNNDLLALTSGPNYATGMGIGIYGSDKTPIPLNQPGENTGLSPNQASVTLNFYARYIANGATVTPGIANAAATFTLTYA